MSKENEQQTWELAEFRDGGKQPIDRLMEEINILRLEGSLFCPDPKEAKRRTGKISFNKLAEHPVTIETNPNYGQPSVLAYRVLQAIFLKMTEEGYPYPDTISFSQRELARLTGREWAGAKTSREFYNAIMQLRSTHIHCALFDNETKEWQAGNFNVLARAYFSGKEKTIKSCVVEVDRQIVRSVNKRHVAFFNLNRLSTLDMIGLMLYKRIFFHLSNIYGPKTCKDELKFEKDYEDICREWLGGLRPQRYKAQILRDQLGRHLDGLRRTRLIRGSNADIVQKRADGSSFKLVFRPAAGFFADYEAYYLERQQSRLRFKQTADLLNIQQPVQAVARFHERLGHDHNTFDEREVGYAAQLLKVHTVPEVNDLIEYAVDRAGETNFRMQRFGAISQYRGRWLADQKRGEAGKRRQAAIAACRFCNEQGMMNVKSRAGGLAVTPCPHDIGKITELEEARDFRRV